ncbi:hypothetical protein SJAV_08320 [Sulfurisphaera javensis]|uniref:Uncharacterized protein n=1 Tax=Sulfurisphaera javensis TaxID=2049879 RepID=A0AAT9GPV3_9CREN
MIRLELLSLSMFITLLALTTASISTPVHLVYNFQTLNLSISPLVENGYITITQNKTDIISEIQINGIIVNVTSSSPYTISLKPGDYSFIIIKEWLYNATTNNFTEIPIKYNATAKVEITKLKLVLHSTLLYYSSIIGSILSLIVYVVRIFKKRKL